MKIIRAKVSALIQNHRGDPVFLVFCFIMLPLDFQVVISLNVGICEATGKFGRAKASRLLLSGIRVS